MGKSVKNIAEVKVLDMHSSLLIYISNNFITEGNQVGQAQHTFGKSMLTVPSHLLLLRGLQGYSLHDFSRDESGTGWPVVAKIDLLASFEVDYDICFVLFVRNLFESP